MFISNSVEQTIAAGRTYGEKARRGDVFALRGDLGAGKTQFVKGFVAGLGSNADVTSPTFVLLHEYGDGRLPVFHFDFYRINSIAEAYDMGYEDFFFSKNLCLIEWPEKIKQLLPQNCLSVYITVENNLRTITVRK